MRAKILLLLATLIIALVCCTPGAADTDCAVIEALLPEESVMEVGLGDIHERVATLYGVSEGNIQVYDYPSSAISTLVIWKHEGSDYSAGFSQERLRRVLVQLPPNRVNFGAVLDCLPEPSHYTFTFDHHAESWRHDLTLWYPEAGLVVSTTRFQNTPEPLIPDRSLAVTDIIWVSSTTVEGMARDLYPHADEDAIQAVLQQVRAWGGSLERLEVTQELE